MLPPRFSLARILAFAMVAVLAIKLFMSPSHEATTSATRSYDGTISYVEPGRRTCWIVLDDRRVVALEYGEPFSQPILDAALAALSNHLRVHVEYRSERRDQIDGDWIESLRVITASATDRRGSDL